MSISDRQSLRLSSNRRANAGVTLVELMVAVVLGLIIIGSVINVFLSSNQIFKVNSNLATLQENARIGFEILARDIRETGATPCGTFPSQVASVVRISSAVPWWANWWGGGSPLRGFEGSENALNTDEIALANGIVATGTAANQRVVNTDSILTLQAAETTSAISAHSNTDKQFTVTNITPFNEADVVVVCDLRGAAIFQIGSISATNKKIDYNTSIASNNCSNNLGAPINLACTTTTSKTFNSADSAQIGKLVSNYWYIGNNSRGSKSLFRITMINKTVNSVKTWIQDTQEVIPGVSDMQIQYLTTDTGNANTIATNWVDANNDTSFPFPPTGTAQIRYWEEQNNSNQVIAAKIKVTLETADSISTSNNKITRSMHFVVGIRSRSHISS